MGKQDIGYANLANLKPQYGLCKFFYPTYHLLSLILPNLWSLIAIFFFLGNISDSSFVPPLVYALMGSSRDIAIGPVAVVSLLLGTLIQSEVDPLTHPTEYMRLMFTATFFAGITQATLGVFRYICVFLQVTLKLNLPFFLSLMENPTIFLPFT